MTYVIPIVLLVVIILLVGLFWPVEPFDDVVAVDEDGIIYPDCPYCPGNSCTGECLNGDDLDGAPEREPVGGFIAYSDPGDETAEAGYGHGV